MGKISKSSEVRPDASVLSASILILDDEKSIVNHIKDRAERYGFRKVFVATTVAAALEILESQNINFLSTDYDLPAQIINDELIDGIGFVKYVLNEPLLSQSIKCFVVYTNVTQETIALSEVEWCQINAVQILNKSIDHGNLFSAIVNSFEGDNFLPLEPKYAFLSEQDLLLNLASPLIEELQKYPKAQFSLGSNNRTISYSELLVEIGKADTHWERSHWDVVFCNKATLFLPQKT